MQGEKKIKQKKNTRICIWYNATQAYLWKEKKEKQQQQQQNPEHLTISLFYPLPKNNSFRKILLSETLY